MHSRILLQVGCILECVEKSKLRVYRELKEDFECKKYLHGVSDMGSKLLFRFRSGTHGLNEELGRHSTRNSSKACLFLWVWVRVCRACFMGMLRV